MADLEISAKLVGQSVCNPARPEWGSGQVLRVQALTVNGQRCHRVSVQFPTGHRTLVVPPARLAVPGAEPERKHGWLDALAGNTLDDRLWRLPADITEQIRTPAQQMAAFEPLYELTDEPTVLVRWARRQADVADPLSLWSRDELLVAFGRFCNERDAYFRLTAARLKQSEGPAAIDDVLTRVSSTAAEAMRAALRRPI